MTKKITKNTTLAEVLDHSGAEEILAKYNLPCLWCPMAKTEAQFLTLGQVCQMYNINLKKLLEDLNNVYNPSSNS